MSHTTPFIYDFIAGYFGGHVGIVNDSFNSTALKKKKSSIPGKVSVALLLDIHSTQLRSEFRLADTCTNREGFFISQPDFDYCFQLKNQMIGSRCIQSDHAHRGPACSLQRGTCAMCRRWSNQCHHLRSRGRRHALPC